EKKVNSTSSSSERRFAVLKIIGNLKQICDHPAQLQKDNSEVTNEDGTPRSGKVDWLTEKLLVFTQYRRMGAILQKHIKRALGSDALFLHGETPLTERQRMIEQFQKSPSGPPVFILTHRAGGTGVNLPRANHVFHFDRWWNPAVENQATDR